MSSDGSRAGFTEWLAGVTAGDAAVLAADAGPDAEPDGDNIEESGLDVRTHALVRLAAVVAAGEACDSYDAYVAAALDQGVTLDEITGVLVALLPTVGPARVTQAAPRLLEAISRITGDRSPVERSGTA